MSELRYQNISEELAPRCRSLELFSFPHANPEELISEEDFRAYSRVFPEGFFVCLDGEEVVGQAGGIFLDFDFDHERSVRGQCVGGARLKAGGVQGERGSAVARVREEGGGRSLDELH